jgi:predicted anti-sigma-YlaC factor YlaD
LACTLQHSASAVRIGYLVAMLALATRSLVLAAVVCGTGCSVQQMALDSLADTLAGSGDTFAADDDPELVREALPFSLKTMEAVLAQEPEHGPLLLAAGRAFTQYAYAFVQLDADLVEAADFERAQALRDRAVKLYLRARDYCLRSLELRHPGLRAHLLKDPAGAMACAQKGDVETLYWTGASWGLAVALGLDRPALVADLPAVRALFDRALVLDESWDRGALHAALISLTASAAMGGTPERARAHFARAVELSGETAAGPYVALAASVALAQQNRAEFERLLRQALAIDVERDHARRLANLLAQRRARHLLSRIDELFLPEDVPEDQSGASEQRRNGGDR